MLMHLWGIQVEVSGRERKCRHGVHKNIRADRKATVEGSQ